MECVCDENWGNKEMVLLSNHEIKNVQRTRMREQQWNVVTTCDYTFCYLYFIFTFLSVYFIYFFFFFSLSRAFFVVLIIYVVYLVLFSVATVLINLLSLQVSWKVKNLCVFAEYSMVSIQGMNSVLCDLLWDFSVNQNRDIQNKKILVSNCFILN